LFSSLTLPAVNRRPMSTSPAGRMIKPSRPSLSIPPIRTVSSWPPTLPVPGDLRSYSQTPARPGRTPTRPMALSPTAATDSRWPVATPAERLMRFVRQYFSRLFKSTSPESIKSSSAPTVGALCVVTTLASGHNIDQPTITTGAVPAARPAPFG